MENIDFTVSSAIVSGIVEGLPIKWHKTTPKLFECEKGCMCCCDRAFFFPSEVELLPEKIVKSLAIRCTKCLTFNSIHATRCQKCGLKLTESEEITPGIYTPKPFKGQSGCVFFNPLKAFHCTIHKYRPMKCKLYPFQPLIDRDLTSIVIICEAFTHIYEREQGKHAEWFRCYGLYKGQNVQSSIKKLSRTFLNKVFEEYPFLGLSVWREEDIDSLIDPDEVAKHRYPKYRTWEEYWKARRLKESGP